MIGCCAASSCLAASPQWVDAVEKVRKCLVTIFSKEAQLNHCRRLNVAPRPLSKSPVSFSLGDEVPQIIIRESHQRPSEIPSGTSLRPLRLSLSQYEVTAPTHATSNGQSPKWLKWRSVRSGPHPPIPCQ